MLVAVILLNGCNNHNHLNKLDFNKDGVLILNNWYMVGPFSYDTTLQSAYTTFFNDDLAKYNIKESHLSPSNAKKLSGEGVPVKFITDKFLTNDLKLFTDSIEHRSNVYLTTNVYSDSELELYMMVDGAASYCIWLNGKLIYLERNKKNISKFCDKFLKVQLKQGKNVFSAKINRESNLYAWGFFIALANREKSQEIFRTNYHENFIINPLVGDSIKFYVGPYEINTAKATCMDDTSLSYDLLFIKSGNEQELFKTSSLKDGFYKAYLDSEGTMLSQLFFKGDLHSFYKKLVYENENKGEKLFSNEEFESLKGRINFCYDNFDSQGESAVKYYNTNLVNWIYRLYSLINNTSSTPNNDFAFRVVDLPKREKKLEYLIKLPEIYYKSQSIPLIVVVPYEIPCSIFSTSWYTANYEQIHIDAKLACERGFAICYLYGNGPEYSPDDFQEEFINVLEHISDYYKKIDANTVYLTGTCSGATRSLILANQVPERIEAVSLRSPLPQANYIDIHFNKIRNIPINIHHGIYDSQIPINSMRKFKNDLQNKFSNFQYAEHEIGHDSYRKDNRKYDFNFFKEIHTDKKR
ncbi:hypothetical protein [Alkalitalea saponilacus]|uniref:hypothetical protein n=1 Tax=Alkalitalea saponilacus TaxID=889453 RepID=UPI001178C33F|nr:hypothetical protein [Alkalitalea saponilacus]